ncbi:MAG: OsmC family protein [Anaerolineaceae bacterium]|nr:OsmC family protein [Anaerolineaceae bacterium]
MASNKFVKITAEGKEKFLIELKAGDFTAYIDQPEAMGGGNTAPTPLHYFLWSLGGCIVTIGKIVAKQQRIELRGLECSVEGGLNTAVFMGKDHEDRAGFEDLTLVVKVDADLTPEQKKAFVEEIDARCPISDNILKSTPIKFEIQ